MSIKERAEALIKEKANCFKLDVLKELYREHDIEMIEYLVNNYSNYRCRICALIRYVIRESCEIHHGHNIKNLLIIRNKIYTCNDNYFMKRAINSNSPSIAKDIYDAAKHKQRLGLYFNRMCRNKSPEMVEKYLFLRKNRGKYDILGFKSAIEGNNLPVLELLFKLGYINTKTFGYDGLCMACKNGNLIIMKYLIDIGVDPYKYDFKLYKLACKVGNANVIKYLEELKHGEHSPSAGVTGAPPRKSDSKILQNLKYQ